MSETSPPTYSDCRLPDRWIERIFAHMAASYGTRFADLWAGQDAATVKAFWAVKLGGFAGRGDVIKAALDALDEQPTPPSLPQFLAICRTQTRRLPSPHLALPAPPPAEATPERLAIIQAFAKSFGKVNSSQSVVLHQTQNAQEGTKSVAGEAIYSQVRGG